MYKTTIKKLADNPVEKRLVGKKQRMKSNRKPFTPDELTRIFDPERMNLCANPADVFRRLSDGNDVPRSKREMVSGSTPKSSANWS